MIGYELTGGEETNRERRNIRFLVEYSNVPKVGCHVYGINGLLLVVSSRNEYLIIAETGACVFSTTEYQNLVNGYRPKRRIVFTIGKKPILAETNRLTSVLENASLRHRQRTPVSAVLLVRGSTSQIPKIAA